LSLLPVLLPMSGSRAMRCTTVAQLAVAAVSFGASAAQIADSFGASAAQVAEIFEAVLEAYPEYSGSLSTGGKVVISQGGSGASAAQVLGWKLDGADIQGCGTGVPDAANACGVHIHSGTTCSHASEVGGHYWVEGSDDPWRNVAYLTATGVTSAVVTGASAEEIQGRVIVVHDSAGNRISCGVIQKLASAAVSCLTATISTYPDYAGSLQVAGTVKVTTGTNGGETAQVVQYDLSGTDLACAQPVSGVSNACGIHVHAGTTCADASAVGGHYWDAAAVGPSDPWSAVVYSAGADGRADGATFPVATGVDSSGILSHAFVVHDSTGARIGCGLLKQPSVPTSAAVTTCGWSGALSLAVALLILQLWVV